MKLQEFSVEERFVLDILTHVNVTRRECEIVSVQTWCPLFGGQKIWGIARFVVL